jgi:hypothetical protein
MNTHTCCKVEDQMKRAMVVSQDRIDLELCVEQVKIRLREHWAVCQ